MEKNTVLLLCLVFIVALGVASAFLCVFTKRLFEDIPKKDVETPLTEISTRLETSAQNENTLLNKQDIMMRELTDERLEAAKRSTETNTVVTQAINEKMLALDKSITGSIDMKMQSLQQLLNGNIDRTNGLHKEILSTVGNMAADSKESQLTMAKSLAESLEQIRRMNEEKLNEINASVSEKLDKSLNERLDSSFKQVGEQLGDLYKTLGELHSLSSGVTDLNKTLSNVKTRGIFGEQQLASILENTMTSSQYETNVAVKRGSSDFVEFAIKIPSKDNDKEVILLPIDSKFPTDIYNRIVAASEQGDTAALMAATKELEQRIKQEARTIRDKYINPPVTTDFAVMFLPTESMYSEVLRINGLTEWCQTNCKIIISGPTTITALLNSLRVGFSNLTLNKKTQEVIKVLQAVKSQYTTLSDLIDKTQKKLSDAATSTEALKKRTDMIQKRMGNIEAIGQSDAEKILAIADETEITEE